MSYLGYFNATISNNGIPITATITVYLAGTATKATIYSTPNGTLKDNPFQTDVLGRFQFFASVGQYDVEISGSGITTYKIQYVNVSDVTKSTQLTDMPQSLSGQARKQLEVMNDETGFELFEPGEVDVRNYASFSTAIDAIGSTEATLLIPNEQNVTADKTVPSNITLRFMRGGQLNISTTVTVTINGPVDAGLWQIFSCAGTGKVLFDTGSVKEIYPQWWGAKGDGVTDDTAAVQAAVDAAAATDGSQHKGMVIFPPDLSFPLSSISVPSGVQLYGNSSRICPISNPAQVFLLNGASVGKYYNKIKEFIVYGDCQNFIKLSGGLITFTEIEDILHTKGAVSDALVNFYNDSATNAPAAIKIRRVYSLPANPALGEAKYLLHFSKSAAEKKNWDLLDISEIALSSNVAGARAIYGSRNLDDGVYVQNSHINDVHLASDPASGAAVVIEGNYDKCHISHVYLETNTQNSYGIYGYFEKCSGDQIGIHSTTTVAGLAAIAGSPIKCVFSNIWVNNNGVWTDTTQAITASIGIGTLSPATSALLDLTSTTGALLLPRMTTIQRDELTPINGMKIYNSTLNKFQGYENGAWVNEI